MDLVKVNEEVFYTRDKISTVDRRDIEFFENKAAENRRKRVRLCFHKDTAAPLHEMLIVLPRGAYARPHKHIGKSEAFHMIKGVFKVIILNEAGGIEDVINMGDYLSGGKFYYRLSESCFHTVMPISDFVVYHETTNGPFRPQDTVFAPWSPAEDELEKQALYINGLAAQLKERV